MNHKNTLLILLQQLILSFILGVVVPYHTPAITQFNLYKPKYIRHGALSNTFNSIKLKKRKITNNVHIYKLYSANRTIIGTEIAPLDHYTCGDRTSQRKYNFKLEFYLLTVQITPNPVNLIEMPSLIPITRAQAPPSPSLCY